ncbi:MAG: hypothetical protein A2103_03340 [Gammaproteobacteria bacterium GWF2_41_13]|nr:MAG: hypothetical protein A2103_03340 [Gammaproteobacteria bacterium GWF2_41_13]
MNHSKVIGSTLIVIGTSIGAGMLALPIISAAAGFLSAVLLLTAVWILMTFTALLLLEATLRFKQYENNFSTMAKATLGIVGQVGAWISCLMLMYALTAAYIAGNTSLIASLFQSIGLHVPDWMNSLLFTGVLGAAIFWSTSVVDYCNRMLISVKGILLASSFAFMLPHINVIHLFDGYPGHSSKYLLAATTIFLCAFGFHNVVPSLVNYVGPEPKTLKKIIITGTTITFIVYFLWLLVTLGIVPLYGVNSFSTVAKAHESVGLFIQLLCALLHSKWLCYGINGFADIAMTTSFFGVALGLFDFLADGFHRSNTRLGRFQSALLTFIPPLVFALFYPEGFIRALGYASFFVIIITILLPVLIVYQLRKRATPISLYRVGGGPWILIGLMILSVGFIGLQILSSLHYLPVLP